MVHFEASTLVHRPIDDVFRYVTDPTNDPSWDPDVITTRLLTPAPIGIGSRIEYLFRFMGRDSVSVGEVVGLEPPHREVIQFEPGMLGAAPRITYRFEEQGEATRFTREAEADVRGLVARLIALLLKRILAGKNVAYVENVRRRLEGEPT